MNFYSNNGEDFIIYLNYLNKYNTKGKYVELGALNGINNSMSKFFEDFLGYSGILIENQIYFFRYLAKTRKNNILVNKNIGDIEKINEKIDKYGSMNNKDNNYIEFKELFKKHKYKNIDILFVDLENNKYDVLSTIDFKLVNIKIIVIKINDKIRTTLKMKELLYNNNFKLDKIYNFNEIWIHNSYKKEKKKYFDNSKKRKLPDLLIKKNKNNIGEFINLKKKNIEILNDYLINNFPTC